MASEIEGTKVKNKTRFTDADWDFLAEKTVSELDRRKQNRSDLEKQWDDIDRQVAIKPDLAFKQDKHGIAIPDMAWMPAMELPLQAQTLEITSADARRLMFPDAGPFFTAHVLADDKYLARVDFKGLIAGDENDVPSVINQENADRLMEGQLNHFHRQYPFAEHWDLTNGEAFKYGTAVGRIRLVTKSIILNTSKGILRETQDLPMYLPISIRNTYLDDSMHNVMNEGLLVGPSIIQTKMHKHADIVLAAQKGSKDPDDIRGGWMPKNLKKLEPDSLGMIEVFEEEGDIVVPRKSTDSVYLPNSIVTYAKGAGGAVAIRYRRNKMPSTSYLIQPYQITDMRSPYGTGPLMNGRPIQIAATSALNGAMAAAELNVRPPISYPRDDAFFQGEGGPVIRPGIKWNTNSSVTPHEIGSPAALFAIYQSLLSQYADVTGTQGPRLGAQTVSHTTAFAKQSEIQRGVIRTVDYVRSVLQGPLPRFLDMEFGMLKSVITRDQTFYADGFGAFVKIPKAAIPDEAIFEVFGAAGPAEDNEKQAAKFAALGQAIELDALKLQAGQQPGVDIDAAQRQILHAGGVTDVDIIMPPGGAQNVG